MDPTLCSRVVRLYSKAGPSQDDPHLKTVHHMSSEVGEYFNSSAK